MSISGSEMYRALQQSIQQSEGRQDEYTTRISEVDQAVQSLLDIRQELFDDLAEEYLPKLDSQSIRATIEEVQTEVVQLLQQKRQAAAELNEQLSKLQKTRSDRQSELEKLTDELNALTTTRDQLEQQASEILDGRPNYVALRKDVDRSTAQLMQNEQRLEELQQEKREKLPSYEEDPLFNYLLDRDYGTTQYTGKGLIRRLDHWVAKLVRFTHHKQHYDFLRSIGDLVQIEIDRRQSELDAQLQEVKSLENEVFAQIGLIKVLQDGEQLGESRIRAIDQLEQLDRKLHETRAELHELDSPNGRHYKRAIDLISAFLEREHIVELRQRAADMPGSTDDRLVNQVLQIEEQLTNHRRQLDELRNARIDSERGLSELSALKSLYVRSDFDSMRSQFDDRLAAKQLFTQVADCILSARQAWQRLKQHQHFQQPILAPSYPPRIQADMSRTLTRAIVRGLGHVARGAASGAVSGRRNYGGGGTIFGGGGRGGGGFSSGEGF